MEVTESLQIENYKIYQDTELYRFTSDAVILSKFASSKKEDCVLDLCSGSGIVGVHHYITTKNAKRVDLVEIQKSLADLSKKTIKLNGLENIFSVINKPLQELDGSFYEKYTLVLCNPPYKKLNSGEVSEKSHIAMCKHEITVTQEEIIKTAKKCLKHGGRLAICQRVERFLDLIVTLDSNKLYPSKIQFVTNKQGVNPYLVLIEATKNVRLKLEILETIVNGG